MLRIYTAYYHLYFGGLRFFVAETSFNVGTNASRTYIEHDKFGVSLKFCKFSKLVRCINPEKGAYGPPGAWYSWYA